MKADTLSNNLSTTTADVETISGDTWVAASFATDANAYSLTSATLLLSNPLRGAAELDLYSSVSGQPGVLLSSFVSPPSFTSGLSPTTFNSSGYSLSPNSNFWLVLKASRGEFDWGWTTDLSGSGVGFTHTWAATDDAGLTWFVSNIEPMQFSVTASPASIVPEPASVILFLFAFVLIIALRTDLFRKGKHV